MSEESTTDWPEPSQTPLFYAVHSERYARQTQIEEYEGRVNRSLIVIKGPIHDGLIPPLSDALSDVDYESPIDLMVTSGGGIPEVALKMATMCRGVNGQRQDMRIVERNKRLRLSMSICVRYLVRPLTRGVLGKPLTSKAHGRLPGSPWPRPAARSSRPALRQR